MNFETFLAPLRGICCEASSLNNVVIPLFSMSGMALEKKMSLSLHYFVDLQLVEHVRSNYIIKNITIRLDIRIAFCYTNHVARACAQAFGTSNEFTVLDLSPREREPLRI